MVSFVRDFLTASLSLPSPPTPLPCVLPMSAELAALVMMARIRSGEPTPVCQSSAKHHSFDFLLSIALPVSSLLIALLVNSIFPRPRQILFYILFANNRTKNLMVGLTKVFIIVIRQKAKHAEDSFENKNVHTAVI